MTKRKNPKFKVWRDRKVSYRPEVCLAEIPPQSKAAHQIIWKLHDILIEALLSVDKEGHLKISIPIDHPGIDLDNLNSFDPTNLTGSDRKDFILKSCLKALIFDASYFLRSSLQALEQRTFSLAVSNLRKPLTENFMHLAWMAADPEEYVGFFCSDTSKEFSRANHPEKRKEIFSKLSKLEDFDEKAITHIEKLVFDRKMPHGIQSLTQRAVHLITNKHESFSTEDWNLNFIFMNKDENIIFEEIYKLVFFPTVLAIKCYNQILKVLKIETPILDRNFDLNVYIWIVSDHIIKQKGMTEDPPPNWICDTCGHEVSHKSERYVLFSLTNEIHCPSCGARETGWLSPITRG